MTECFTIRVQGDDLTMSVAHFITFDDGTCERLHGHNYLVAAEVELPLGPAGYTMDFALVKRALREVLDRLDHRVLLPMEHPALRVSEQSSETEVALGGRRWVFPTCDCAPLPLANATAELLARHVARELLARLVSQGGNRPGRLRVEMEESPGQRAACELSSP